jgi:hypothetical protein
MSTSIQKRLTGKQSVDRAVPDYVRDVEQQVEKRSVLMKTGEGTT